MSTNRRVCPGAALLILTLLTSAAAAQAHVAALPQLALDTYPSPMREAVAGAYRDAKGRPADAKAAGSLARLLHAWEQWETAHQAYARAAALAPRVFDWPYLDACVLQCLVRPAEAVSRLKDALAISPIAELEAALALDTSLVVVHESLMKLYGRPRDWAKAEAHYHSAVAMGSNQADLHYDYGVLLSLQEKWDQAAEACGRALAVNPQHGQAHNNLGQLFERERRFDAALEEYKRAIDSQPTFRLARFNAGRALLALGPPRDAVAEFDKLQQPRDGESPRYLFALAVAHIRAGDKDEGIKWAAEAKGLATEYGQRDPAAAIEQQLGSLK